MKPNLWMLVSLLCVGLSGAIALKTSAQTSVVNGGFESGFGGVDAIWTQAGTQPPPRTTADAHSGSYCMDLSVTNVDLTANTSEIDQNTFNSGGGAVTPGESYTFSFWAKQISSGVSYVQFYKVSFLDTNGAIVLDPGFTMFNGGNGVWSQITRTNLVAPANAVSTYIQIYTATGAVMGGSGEVLIDDVTLAAVQPGHSAPVPIAFQAGSQVGWTSANGAQDQVQWSADNASWSNLGAAVAGVSGALSAFDPAKHPFYRVVQQIQGSGGNQMTNPGFEIAGVTSSNAANWAVTQAAGGPVSAVRTNAGAHAGSSAFAIHLASTGAGPVVRLEQSGVPVTGGATYTFSFFANSLAGSAGAAPQWDIQWFNPGFIGEAGFHGYTPGNNVYTQITNSVTAPSNATTATIIFYTPGAAATNQSANILLDDISFSSGGGSAQTNVVAATAQPAVQISWASASGANYQVQSASNLMSTNTAWSSFGGVVAGDGTVKSASDLSSATRKFYQVIQLP
ncbi:MAG: hypothetical protein JWR26_4209 [Pedosphaera sp.]|nr:hypothetical protein [Pedosphaera sp.]